MRPLGLLWEVVTHTLPNKFTHTGCLQLGAFGSEYSSAERPRPAPAPGDPFDPMTGYRTFVAQVRRPRFLQPGNGFGHLATVSRD